MKLLGRLVFGVIVAFAILAIMEASLRIAGFHHEATPVVLRFGYPNTREIVDLFRPDRRLFWRLKPESVFDAEGPVRINALGYRGPLPSTPKPLGGLRIAVLGDSVAFGSTRAWPTVLRESLRARFEDRSVEVLNFGVPGYSVVQGLRQFRDDVASLSPDVVLIGYGWNDHWLAKGQLSDSERRISNITVARAGAWASRLRIVQAVHLVLPETTQSSKSSTIVRRVPPADFKDHMLRLIGEARDAGARPLVLALPSGLTVEEFPSYLLDLGFAADAASAIDDHRLYARLSEEAAAEQNALFLDLDPYFRTDDSKSIAEFFTRDQIHPSPAGYELLGSVVKDWMLESDMIPR